MFKLMGKKIIAILRSKSLRILTYVRVVSCVKIFRPLDCVIKNQFAYISIRTYVVGIQKKGLNEMILMSSENICKN